MICFQTVDSVNGDLKHYETAARQLYLKAWQNRDESLAEQGYQQLEKLRQLQRQMKGKEK